MLAPEATQRPFKMYAKFWSILMSGFDKFLIDFETQNGAKNDQKSIHKAIKKLIDFLIDFLSIFGPFLVPCWAPKSTQNWTKMSSKKMSKKSYQHEAKMRQKRWKKSCEAGTVAEDAGPLED